MKQKYERKINPNWVCLEGVDGVGKSTVAQEIQKRWHPDTQIIEEPHGTEVGRQGFALTQNQAYPKARALTFAGVVCESYQKNILPRLAYGYQVISVRSYPSTLVYQGEDQGVAEFIWGVYQQLFQRMSYLPLVFVLHTPNSTLAERYLNRPDEETDPADLELLYYYQEKYLTLASRYGWEVVNAEPTPEEISVEILERIRTFGRGQYFDFTTKMC